MKNYIVTIGRQFGSGGRYIGKKLSEALGCDYYDKEILTLAAKESGLSPEFLDRCDENHTGSLLFSLVMGDTGAYVGGNWNASVEQIAAKAQHEAILKAADKGNCVIIGRCADYILREREELVRVFINADPKDRVKWICERENLQKNAAADKIRKIDKSRTSYYNYNTDQHWGFASNYDLCINVSKIGADGAVKLIIDYLENR